VLFSSHLLHEVERVSDHVAMIHQGRVVFSAALDDVKETHRCLTLRFDEARPRPPALAGALTWEGDGREWTALCSGHPGEAHAAAAACGARVVGERVPSLDEIFVARAGTRCLATAEG
jgi:ABC-2 type transport system ATP-binding protein